MKHINEKMSNAFMAAGYKKESSQHQVENKANAKPRVIARPTQYGPPPVEESKWSEQGNWNKVSVVFGD